MYMKDCIEQFVDRKNSFLTRKGGILMCGLTTDL